jgi:hypothetical protein
MIVKSNMVGAQNDECLYPKDFFESLSILLGSIEDRINAFCTQNSGDKMQCPRMIIGITLTLRRRASAQDSKSAATDPQLPKQECWECE